MVVGSSMMDMVSLAKSMITLMLFCVIYKALFLLISEFEDLTGGYSHVLLKGHLRLGLIQAAYFISLLHIST